MLSLDNAQFSLITINKPGSSEFAGAVHVMMPLHSLQRRQCMIAEGRSIIHVLAAA